MQLVDDDGAQLVEAVLFQHAVDGQVGSLKRAHERAWGPRGAVTRAGRAEEKARGRDEVDMKQNGPRSFAKQRGAEATTAPFTLPPPLFLSARWRQQCRLCMVAYFFSQQTRGKG